MEVVLEEGGRVQLERRVPWRSAWERKRVRAAVSFEAAEEEEVAVVKKERWMMRRRTSDKNVVQRSIGGQRERA